MSSAGEWGVFMTVMVGGLCSTLKADNSSLSDYIPRDKVFIIFVSFFKTGFIFFLGDSF